MTVDFENNTDVTFPFDAKQVATDVILQSCEDCDFPYEPEVHVYLVDEDTIQEINRDNRQIDAVTDVLSFPMLSFETPEIITEAQLIAQDAFDPDSGEAILGDIVICVQRVAQQAAEYGHSLKREFAFLVAHSMLHLFGHDHMTPEEAAVMEKKQEAVLHKLHITRELEE